jgi:uncharacterized protein YheU (UPF0270 family)
MQVDDEADEAVLEDAYVVVPHTALSTSALAGLVEEFITREGTEYGAREYTLDEKTASVMRLLQLGEVYIGFDPESGTTTLHRKTGRLR